MAQDEVTGTCEECGASVYQETLDSGIARRENGKLLCAHCVTESERSSDAADGEAVDELAPIEMESRASRRGAKSDMSSSRIRAAEGTRGSADALDDTRYKRPLRPDNVGATRCRTFHCRISQGAIDFMNNQMNEWLDQSPEITLKFVTSTIGMFEGKHTEPNIIMTVFY